MTTQTNIAESVIKKCGGAAVVASWLGITPKSVHCWKYPREKGGSDGFIPSKYQGEILLYAKENGVLLEPEDFIDPHVRLRLSQNTPAEQ